MRHVIVASLLALGAGLATAFIENEFYLRLLFMVCVYFLCAAGMNVLLGFAGQKSLGQAGLFAAGAYGAALLTTRYDLDPWLAFGLSAVVAGICGVLIALPSLRVKGPSLAMVTLAFGLVVEKLVSQASEYFGGAMGIYAIKPLAIAGEPFTMTQWVWFAILLAFVTHVALRNLLMGRFGRAFASLREDEIAAASVGVAVYRYKVLAFVIAAVTCGLAGALVAQQNQYINSDFITFNLSIFILLLVLFGGSGSLAGPLIGAVLLVALNALLARWSWIEHFAHGALLLLALYAMPRGVAGLFSDIFARFAPTAAAAAQVAQPAALPVRATDWPADAPLLEARNLNKAYGGVVPARDVSVMLRQGHIHALIGPNGAGKTTFINMLTGLVTPDSGSIRFAGADLGGMAVHAVSARGVVRTFQNLRLFKQLSALDNVLLGAHTRMRNGFLSSLAGLPGARREEARARVQAANILAFTGLAHVAGEPAGSLAYGLQRRLELARALAAEPVLLLLDEPAAGLNPHETAELGALLVRIRDQGITILLIEHHMDLVMAISDHVIVLDYGEKIAEGPPEAVKHDGRVVEAYLGTAEDDAEAVGAAPEPHRAATTVEAR